MKKANLFLKIFFLFSVISMSQTAQCDPVYIKLTGTPFFNGVDGTNALDGDITTYIDGDANGSYAGLNLGVLTEVTKLRFYPRSGQTGRMTGGTFQGSNDNVNYTTFYTISSEPAGGAWTEVLLVADYQYVRYMTPANGHCNVAELEFWTTQGAVPTVVSVQSVSIEHPTYTLKAGEIVQVNNTILPANATDQTFTYSFVPSAIASIDATGRLTGLSAGTGTITVTTEDGAKTATSDVTINAATELKLTGTQFGGTQIDSNNKGEAAFDDNINSWSDTGDVGAYTGLNFGSVQNISKIRFYPRPNWTSRMTSGIFQGSNDNVDYTNIYTINSQPTDNVWTEVLVTESYQYVRYLGPANGYLNVAEIEFWTPVSNVSTELTKPNLMKVDLYPNPAKNKMQLSVNADKIIITEIDGKEVLTTKGSSVDVSFLKSGIYFVKYFVGQNIGVSKIIKQ